LFFFKRYEFKWLDLPAPIPPHHIWTDALFNINGYLSNSFDNC
jgi:hypothetical protein